MKKQSFHEELKGLMDELVHLVFDAALTFSKEERFDLVSQLKRAALSTILNYVEGYARQRKAVMKNFFEISYGSLKETKYLLYFSFKRGFIPKNEYQKTFELNERIGKMLWGTIVKM